MLARHQHDCARPAPEPPHSRTCAARLGGAGLSEIRTALARERRANILSFHTNGLTYRRDDRKNSRARQGTGVPCCCHLPRVTMAYQEVYNRRYYYIQEKKNSSYLATGKTMLSVRSLQKAQCIKKCDSS